MIMRSEIAHRHFVHGQCLRLERQRLGISLRRFSDEIGFSAGYLCRIERAPGETPVGPEFAACLTAWFAKHGGTV